MFNTNLHQWPRWMLENVGGEIDVHFELPACPINYISGTLAR